MYTTHQAEGTDCLHEITYDKDADTHHHVTFVGTGELMDICAVVDKPTRKIHHVSKLVKYQKTREQTYVKSYPFLFCP